MGEKQVDDWKMLGENVVGEDWEDLEKIVRNKHLQVVWVPRDASVQSLLDKYLNREIDYLALTTQFRRNRWSTAGLFEVIQQMEKERRERLMRK